MEFHASSCALSMQRAAEESLQVDVYSTAFKTDSPVPIRPRRALVQEPI